MLKNVPDFVIIGAHRIDVEATTEDEFEKMWWGDNKPEIDDDEMFETIGYYSHKNNRIHLWTKLEGTRKAASLLHEIIEAINWQNDLELTHTQLSTLAESLLTLFLQNDLDFKKIIQE